MLLTTPLRSSSRSTVEQGVSTTASASENTHALISWHVDEARKISWSLGVTILRTGVLYVQVESSAGGGSGRVGVSGTGVGFSGPCLRRRGSSLGMRSLRFGMEEVACPAGGWEAGCDAIQSRYIYEGFSVWVLRGELRKVVIVNGGLFGESSRVQCLAGR